MKPLEETKKAATKEIKKVAMEETPNSKATTKKKA